MSNEPILRPRESTLAKEYLGRAKEIGPLLAKARDHGEKNGCMAEDAFATLRGAGFLDFFKPKSVGGVEADLATYLDVAAEISRYDTTAGWMMMVSDSWWLMRTASEERIEELRGEPDAFVTTSLNKPLHAEQVEGGYRVSGDTPFMSGCRHAQWIGHGAVVHRDGEPVLRDGAPLQLIMHQPADAVEIEDDWDTLGMRGTSSNTIRVKDAFVPEHRTFGIEAANGIGSHFGGPLYRCAMQSINVTMPAVALGATRVALDTLSEIAQHKVPFQASSTLKHKQLAQVHYGRALASYRAAYGLLRAAMERAWAKAVHGERFSLEERADLCLAATYALETSADATREVATAAASSTIYKNCPIEHAVRDVEVLRHHGFTPEGRYGTVAQCYWGLEPDTPLVSID